MKYKVGDPVVLVEGAFVPPEIEMPRKIQEVTPGDKRPYKITFGRNGYFTFHFADDVIDHEKTAELHKQRTLNHYSGELEKVVAEKNGHEIEQTDAIEPPHYNKGEIDLYEAAYLTRPFNEYRAIMEFVAERYIKRDKENRVEDLDKAIYTLERLKEKEDEHAGD